MQPQTTQDAPTVRGGPNSTTQAQPRDASGGTTAQRDGTPGNPPSTATQRGADAVTGNRTPPDGTPGNPPGTAAGRALGTTDNASGTSAGATTGSLAVDSATARSGRRASKVIGANVYNENNESIGEVDDILIPPGGGAPVAVISVGGFLGIGAKLVAVPYDRLQNTNSSRWTLAGATKDSLTSLPTFAYDTSADRRG
jgi:hypothetical protein